MWITNAIALRATPEVIRELAASPLVAAIDPDRVVAGPEPSRAADSAPSEPNILAIGAPDLWAAGIRGAGTVVASMDTGVDVSHPDLVDRYRGGTNSWLDPYGQHLGGPVDLNGHGTQTLGVAVGGTAGGTSIGVAPGAQWIAVKAFADNGFATTSGLHLAFQWLLDPDADPATADEPDVVNASWGMGSPGCDLTFEPDLAALVAGGIVPVVAAGNTGPGSGSGSSPANNPSAFSVGAVDNADLVATFSPRSPDGCGIA
jgi:subtilisin family serine protease